MMTENPDNRRLFELLGEVTFNQRELLEEVDALVLERAELKSARTDNDKWSDIAALAELHSDADCLSVAKALREQVAMGTRSREHEELKSKNERLTKALKAAHDGDPELLDAIYAVIGKRKGLSVTGATVAMIETMKELLTTLAKAEPGSHVSRWAHVASMAQLTDEATAFGVAYKLRAQGAASALAAYPTGKALDEWRDGYVFRLTDTDASHTEASIRSSGLALKEDDRGVVLSWYENPKLLAAIIGALIETHGKMTEGDDGE